MGKDDEDSPWPEHHEPEDEGLKQYEYQVESLEVPFGYKPEQGARLIEETLNDYGKEGWICYPPFNVSAQHVSDYGVDVSQVSQLLIIYMYRPRQ